MDLPARSLQRPPQYSRAASSVLSTRAGKSAARVKGSSDRMTTAPSRTAKSGCSTVAADELHEAITSAPRTEKARVAVDLHVENCPAMWGKLSSPRDGAYPAIEGHRVLSRDRATRESTAIGAPGCPASGTIREDGAARRTRAAPSWGRGSPPE